MNIGSGPDVACKALVGRPYPEQVRLLKVVRLAAKYTETGLDREEKEGCEALSLKVHLWPGVRPAGFSVCSLTICPSSSTFQLEHGVKPLVQ